MHTTITSCLCNRASFAAGCIPYAEKASRLFSVQSSLITSRVGGKDSQLGGNEEKNKFEGNSLSAASSFFAISFLVFVSHDQSSAKERKISAIGTQKEVFKKTFLFCRGHILYFVIASSCSFVRRLLARQKDRGAHSLFTSDSEKT